MGAIEFVQVLAAVYLAATSLWFWFLVGGLYLAFGYSFWLVSPRYSPFGERPGVNAWLAAGAAVVLGATLAVKGVVLEKYLYHFADEPWFLGAGAAALAYFAALYGSPDRREVPHWPADLLATVLAAIAYVVALLR